MTTMLINQPVKCRPVHTRRLAIYLPIVSVTTTDFDQILNLPCLPIVLLPWFFHLTAVRQALAGSARRLAMNVDFRATPVAIRALEPDSLTTEIHGCTRQLDALVDLVPLTLVDAEAVIQPCHVRTRCHHDASHSLSVVIKPLSAKYVGQLCLICGIPINKQSITLPASDIYGSTDLHKRFSITIPGHSAISL